MPSGVYRRKLIPLRDRIERRIVKDKSTGCWVWQGATHPFGYGNIAIGGHGADGKSPVRVHRAMWGLERGPIPENMCVLHKCDNPSCCNPDHLFLGTKADNSRDMVEKNRCNPHGKPTRRKLTQAKADEIRATTGMTQVRLAAKYGVSQTNISLIQTNKHWSTPKRDQSRI